MTLYLQRLFDRAQGQDLAMQAAVAAANRLDAPSAELDQRLSEGVPDLSRLAGLMGEFEPEAPAFDGVAGRDAPTEGGRPEPIPETPATEARPLPQKISGAAAAPASPLRPAVVATDPVRPAPVVTRLERQEPDEHVSPSEAAAPAQMPASASPEVRAEPGERTIVKAVTKIETRRETVIREIAAVPSHSEPAVQRAEPVIVPAESRPAEAKPSVAPGPIPREVERIVEAAPAPAQAIGRIEPAPLRDAEPPEPAPVIAPPRQSPAPAPEAAPRRNEVPSPVPSPSPSLSQRTDGPAILSAEQASLIGPLERLRPVLTLRGLRRR